MVKPLTVASCFPEPTGSGLIEGLLRSDYVCQSGSFPEPTGSGLIEGINSIRISDTSADVFRSQPAPASLKVFLGNRRPPHRASFPEPTGSGLIEGQVKFVLS